MIEHDRAGAVAAFHEANDRWPSASGATDRERTLGRWLERCRSAAAGGVLDEETWTLLDDVAPGWMVSADERWATKARELSNFLLAEGRLPSRHAEDPAESLKALWAAGQRQVAAMGLLRPDRQAWLDAYCPGWSAPATNLRKDHV